jgi:hypothetical protein
MCTELLSSDSHNVDFILVKWKTISFFILHTNCINGSKKTSEKWDFYMTFL